MLRTALAMTAALTLAPLALAGPALAFSDGPERPGYTGYVINDENANRRHTDALREPFLRTRNQGLLGAYLFRRGAGPVVDVAPNDRPRPLRRR